MVIDQRRCRYGEAWVAEKRQTGVSNDQDVETAHVWNSAVQDLRPGGQRDRETLGSEWGLLGQAP